MTLPTGPTFTTLMPQTLTVLMTMGIENAAWLHNVQKISGLNETEPFYACEKFWRSPFEISFETKDRISSITFDDLCNALIEVGKSHLDILATLEKGNFTASQADRFARLVFLGKQ